MRHLILGTAGHIDHGKTALVRALTGVDTDRLPEEKRRGITIDLGFARLPLRNGIEVGIVDVPGHEAFVRNMLAGATGIDMVLLVVAADESVMPQTREHLAIIELLGIRRAVVALTKMDLVESAWLELVRDEVAELLAPTPLADSPIVPVSARTGSGLDALSDALAGTATQVATRDATDLFRMPIDRVFTVRGTGTVVTGTVWSGTLQRDAQVRIEPAGLTARVRTLQRHGADAPEVAAGERAAVALAGIDRAQLSRGDTLLAGAAWSAASILTAEIRVLRDAAPLRPRQRVRVHLGTAEVLGRIALLDGELAPGASAIAQLRLEQPLVARAGDHLVLRSYSPVHTIAGGLVLEPMAPKRKRLTSAQKAALRDLLDTRSALTALLALRGSAGVRRNELPLLCALPPHHLPTLVDQADVVTLGDSIIAVHHLADCRTRITRALAAFHSANALDNGLDREALRRASGGHDAPPLFDRALHDLATDGTIVSQGSVIALATHRPVAAHDQQARLARLAALYADAALHAPDLAELPPDLAAAPDLLTLLRFLERQGRLVKLSQTRFADADALASAVAQLRSQLPAGQPLGVAAFKGVLNLSRKHLIPILEYLDRTGVTVRSGEARLLNAPRRVAAG